MGSSSSLEVKSITADMGRLPLVVASPRGATDEDDCSRDNGVMLVGVANTRGKPVFMASPVLVISIRSSSSSLMLAAPFDLLASGFLLSCHLPSG